MLCLINQATTLRHSLIATMANSLEGRSQVLYHKMLEFCAAMPSKMKIKGTKLKHIIKRAISKALP